MRLQNRREPSIQARILALLDEEPEAEALCFVDRRRRVEWATRADVHRRACAVASELQGQGARPGDISILTLPSDETAAYLLLGVLLGGGVPVLMSPPVVRGEHSNLTAVLEHLMARSGARWVITARDLAEQITDLETPPGVTVLFDDELSDGDPTTAVMASRSADDVAAMQLTSGTTGFPRICAWDHSSVMAALDGMNAAMKLERSDICLNWTPLYHDMGLVNNFLLSLCYGVPLAMLPTMEFLRRPALWLQAASDTGATQTWSPNFGFALATHRIGNHELEGVRLDRVRAFWNAAERIHLQTIEEFYRRFQDSGVRRSSLKTNFGCAENIGGATFSAVDGEFLHERISYDRLTRDGLAEPAREGQKRTISVVSAGRPYPGLEIEIVSESGESLPDGRIGEVVLHTPSRMRGYLGDESTAPGDRARPLMTGDLGYLRDGEFFWTGRLRERINLHGKKYDPSDFEHALLEVDGLREGCFAAFGIDDAELGTQRLVIVAEVREPADRKWREIAEDVIARILAEGGPTASDVVLLPYASMTKTSSGKRRHSTYRRLYEDGQLEPLFSLLA